LALLKAVRAQSSDDVKKRQAMEAAFSGVSGKSSGGVQQEIYSMADSRASKQISIIEKSRLNKNEKSLITEKKTKDYDQTVADLTRANPLGYVGDIQKEASKRVMQRSAAGKYNLSESEKNDVKSRSLVNDEEKRDIYQITDEGNKWLNERGFKRQNFVLTAFAADLLEYFPNYLNKYGLVYAGTNATKCIKAIFPKVNKKVSEFEYINEVLQFQSKRYDLTPIDCEDSRNCDLVRYFQEYQSQHHVIKNKGVKMKNNSILKQTIGLDKYYEFSNNLK
jgi:DNA-binding PadR family transcriptional regulator